MATGDDVQLTDLEVIQQFSLAVRGATASRAQVVAALEADLAWLTGRRSAPTAGAAPDAVGPASTSPSVGRAAPGKTPAVRAASSRAAAPTKRAASPRTGTAAKTVRSAGAPAAAPDAPTTGSTAARPAGGRRRA